MLGIFHWDNIVNRNFFGHNNRDMNPIPGPDQMFGNHWFKALHGTHGHTDTQTHRHTDTQTHRHTDTKTGACMKRL